jgi:hypothetical protein
VRSQRELFESQATFGIGRLLGVSLS